MTTALIYHVIGTIGERHVRWSLESLRRQRVKWDTFVLYNGGSVPTSMILPLVPKSFKTILVFGYDRQTPKSSIADWDVQMREIGGHDRYLVHKADFYLADGACKAFEEIEAVSPWFALFHKFDMKEKVPFRTFRRYASATLEECLAFEETGSYEDHRGYSAIPFLQNEHGMDGTMHGYSDETRPLFTPSENEREIPWGPATAIQKLASRTHLVLDPRLFALHIFHDFPDKTDPRKAEPGERF